VISQTKRDTLVLQARVGSRPETVINKYMSFRGSYNKMEIPARIIISEEEEKGRSRKNSNMNKFSLFQFTI
jgi:hypothetical protein